MRERSVTRAAERLGRTQSAVSHSLSRLRDQLGDPLLDQGRQAHGAHSPSALEFIEQVRPLAARHRTGAVTLGTGSSRQPLAPRLPAGGARFCARPVHRPAGRSAHRRRPALPVEWTGPRETMLLEGRGGTGRHRHFTGAGSAVPAGVVGEDIGALEWRCFASRGHPAFQKWGARAWARWPHLVVRVGDQLESPVNVCRQPAAGLRRTIAGWVPNFSVIAPVLAASDLLATLPGARHGRHAPPLRPRVRDACTFAIGPIPHVMLWSAARARIPEIAWLRNRLRPLAKSRFTSLAG